AEEHLLLPQADLRAPLPSPVTDWLAACRASVEEVRGALGELTTREAREEVVGRGVGGDDTTAIDKVAEDVIVACLDATGADFLGGRRLEALPRLDRIEILSLEATQTDLVALHAPQLVGVVRRLRILGSLALSLCHLAAGRLDAVCSLRPARAVDIAAGQLL